MPRHAATALPLHLMSLLALVCLLVALPFVGTAAPADDSFADCVINDRVDHPMLDCGDELIDIRRDFDGALARIRSRLDDGITTTGIYERYVAMLSDADQSRVANLNELSRLLAISYPELYAAYTVDVSSALARLRDQVSTQTAALVRIYARFDPLIGAAPAVPDDGETLADIIRDLGIGNFVVSSEPADIMALETDPPVIMQPPFRFSNLEAALFHAHDLAGVPTNTIDEYSTFHVEFGAFCNGAATCIWPAGYDYIPSDVAVVWEHGTLSRSVIDEIVQEDGYVMTLSVNGTRLHLGAPPGQGVAHDYYAVAMSPTPAADRGPTCPAGVVCIATAISRAALRNFALPWRIQFEVEKLVELDPPIVIIDPDSGEPVAWATGREPFASAAKTINANATNGLSFFEEALAPTFKSDRCMDCHGFGTPDNLAVHHDYIGPNGTSSFIANVDLKLAPSLYVPNAHVMTCNSCHVVPATDNNGFPFEETEWIAPYVDLDVDWRSKNVSQICSRVRQNLPTPTLQQQHFSGDGRLFWAIQAPYIGGTQLLPKAYPRDHDRFLERTLIWSHLVQNCP